MQVSRSEVTILCDAAEFKESIDVARATRELEEARQRLSNKFSDIEVESARVALRKALNRIRVAKQKRDKLIQ